MFARRAHSGEELVPAFCKKSCGSSRPPGRLFTKPTARLTKRTARLLVLTDARLRGLELLAAHGGEPLLHLEHFRFVPVGEVGDERVVVDAIAPGGEAAEEHRVGAEKEQGKIKLEAEVALHALPQAGNMPPAQIAARTAAMHLFVFAKQLGFAHAG